MGITDLEEQFTFYASYHHTPGNKWVHIFCVWPILWSAFVLSHYLPLPSVQVFAFHPFNITFLAALFYAGVYVTMDKRAGSLGALLVILCLITARRFYLVDGGLWGLNAWQFATLVHVACWIAQFVGHGVIEGRAPALFDNMMQAFVMAPLFVLLEVLFMFGYRKDFQRKVEKNVAVEIRKFRTQLNNK